MVVRVIGQRRLGRIAAAAQEVDRLLPELAPHLAACRNFMRMLDEHRRPGPERFPAMTRGFMEIFCDCEDRVHAARGFKPHDLCHSLVCIVERVGFDDNGRPCVQAIGLGEFHDVSATFYHSHIITVVLTDFEEVAD